MQVCHRALAKIGGTFANTGTRDRKKPAEPSCYAARVRNALPGGVPAFPAIQR